MALHIQMSEEAEAELRRTALRNKLSSIAACLAFILFGGGIMFFTVILIAIEPEAEFISYVQPADDAPPRPTPTTPQLSAKQSSPSNTVAPSVIVANAAAPVAMAQVDIPMDDSTDDGMSLDIGMGLDGGLGDGLGDGGSGFGSSQGGGSALEGTFYDLKQTKNGAPNGNANAQNVVNKDAVLSIINDFVTKGWNASSLNKYYQSPTKLYASNFCIPACNASYAPVAYQCQDKVKPAGWMAVYRGKVKAPKTGKFRFVGTGDECVIVRFNRDIVLEAGYMIPSLGKTNGECHVAGKNINSADFKRWEELIKTGDKYHKGYEFFPHPDCPHWNKELGGLMAGKEISVKEGQTYPIEILVTEIPGGAFGAVLMIQETTNGKTKDVKSLQLFRTNFSQPDEAELKKLIGSHARSDLPIKVPAYDPESLIWVAVP